MKTMRKVAVLAATVGAIAVAAPAQAGIGIIYYSDYAGGILVDQGAHVFDGIHMLMNAGYPESVTAAAGKPHRFDTPESVTACAEYPHLWSS